MGTGIEASVDLLQPMPILTIKNIKKQPYTANADAFVIFWSYN